LAYDWRSRAFIALSVIGIAVAIYHAYGELTYAVGGLGSCSLSKSISCAGVFASGYTTFPPAGSIPGLSKGIEFWVYGVVWFPVCLIVGLWALRRYGGLKRSVMVPFLMVGNIFTLYPWDIEIRILGGVYCIVCVSLYCLNYLMTFVALTSTPDPSKS
jgi:Vitamin K epoxide reductase family